MRWVANEDAARVGAEKAQTQADREFVAAYHQEELWRLIKHVRAEIDSQGCSRELR